MWPGPFSSIGKQAKDLLTRDFNFDKKFSISTTTASGINFTSTGSIKGDSFTSGDVLATIHQGGVKTEIKVDTKSTVNGSVAFGTPVPGLKCVLSGNIPDQLSGKIEAFYLRDYLNFSGSTTLNTSPVLQGSLSLGAENLTLGGEIGYDTSTNALTKYNAGVGFAKDDFAAALILADKADTIKASFHQSLSHTSSFAVEISHKFSKNDTVITTGALSKLDPLTTSKLRLNSLGVVSALISHEWRPKSFIAISGEVDSKALEKSAKLGVSLSLRA